MIDKMNAVAKKLHIKSGQHWLFYNAPDNYLPLIEPLPDGVLADFAPIGNFDGIQLFVANNLQLIESLNVLAPLLKAETVFWITYPKKSSGIASDLEMMGDWDELAKYGLRVVSAASINETWTALRFRMEGLSKLSETRNAAIKTNNEYAAYIDVEKKLITLPPEMEEVLGRSSAAMSFYQSLSYSNKKEYVVWIISAKQENTKADRLGKLIDKLSAGKKNPSEK
jgi:Bacteriocin-protection, YdeI or OmpD-Associated